MRRPASFALALILLPAAALATDPPRPLPPEPPHTADITAEEFLWHDAWLADDARAGRETGTPECREAAAFVAGRMETMGLEKVPGLDGWYQHWPTPGGKVVERGCRLAASRATPAGKAEAGEYPYGEDFVVLTGSGSGEVEAPVVFAGYGITAPEFGYDDYAGLDARGKVVVVLRHEPGERDPESRWNGDRMTRHSAFLFKARAASAAGAAAVVVVNDPLNHGDEPLEALSLGMPSLPFPFVMASRRAAEALLAGADLEALQRTLDGKDAPASFAPEGVRARLRVDLEVTTAENVAGMLRGSDPALRDEWVVVGAHYDHVGLGAQSSMDPAGKGKIHNGADDNASGTAALLEIAEQFALGKGRTRRSLLFLAFSGEEKGLLGSRHFVRTPPVPVDRMAAMINLDMVGRYRPGQLDLVGADSGSTLRETLERAGEGLGLEYEHTNGGLSQSDGFHFHEAGVPTVFFFTGFHDDYHRPGDDWWKVNAEGGAAVATMAARAVRALADADGRPAYRKIPRSAMRMRPPTRTVLGVLLGPDAPEGGAVVGSVSPNSPAAGAGLRPGDRIVAFGGTEVKDAAGLRAALDRTHPGDRVKVGLVRDGKATEVEAQFPAPPSPAPVFGVTYAAGPTGGKGVRVEEVARGSVAEAAGLRAGDRVLSFGGTEVGDGQALGKALSGARPGVAVEVRVLRGEEEIVLEAKYPK